MTTETSVSVVQGAVEATLPAAQQSLVDYYRCPPDLAAFETAADLSVAAGFFTFAGIRCFGRAAGIKPSKDTRKLNEQAARVDATAKGSMLPFDLADVVTNLREERYRRGADTLLTRLASSSAVTELYYLLRPALGIAVRRHFQRARLRGWKDIPFPRWPVDTSVDDLMRETVASVLRSTGLDRIPFVWFWPEGAPTCTMLTHDVEGETGVGFLSELMNIDDRFGLKSSFQLIPEGTGEPWSRAEEIRGRGFEANVHDINHDGRLYRDKAVFLERARKINDYAKQFKARGFRSGAMYREQSWYDAFEFEYDMSVPNTAHLEPQRGGCCTVMPYFIGGILELPLTLAQDYSLFHILGDYSTRLWQEQISLVREQNGLLSIITHPDYLIGEQERSVYIKLLEMVASLRDRGETWVALPAAINEWWRQRQAMTLVAHGSSWRVEGPASHRARVAYASLDGDRVVYRVEA